MFTLKCSMCHRVYMFDIFIMNEMFIHREPRRICNVLKYIFSEVFFFENTDTVNTLK